MRLLKGCAALLACVLLSSCASLLGPRQVEVPLWKLQQSLDRRFPMDSRALELFAVSLSRPQLQLAPQDERVALSFDTSITTPVVRRVWIGTMALSGRLGLDNVRNEVLLRDARVDRFDIDGLDPHGREQLARVANVVLSRVVRDVPVYSFDPRELRVAGVQFMPTRIATTARSLIVTLEPVR